MSSQMKHYINYTDHIYYIEKDDVIVMSVELDKDKNQIIIKTPKEVYAGPIELISFLENVKK